jgi:hypothetical protein
MTKIFRPLQTVTLNDGVAYSNRTTSVRKEGGRRMACVEMDI